MELTTIALIYGIGGAIIFSIALKLFSVEHKFIHTLIACCAAGFTTLVVPNGAGIISLIVMVVIFKILSKLEFQDFIIPAFASRLGLIPILLLFNINIL